MTQRSLFLAVVLVGALVAACTHDITGVKPPPPPPPPDTTPVLHDPTVLVRNHTAERAYFTWQSGTTIFGADTIPAGITRCERFTAVADSAYWLIATDTSADGFWAKVWTNYFDPATRPAWTADINGGDPQNITIVQKDTTAEC